MSRALVCLATAVLLYSAAFAALAIPERPIPQIEHVIVISIDGLRPDLALRAEMPMLREMLREGSYTFWAKTTAVSITLPSHTSMMTGVIPDRHGISWNSDLPFSKPVHPRVPTVLELATRAGYVTAMAAGKSKFATLNKPDTITHVFVPQEDNSSVDDATVAAKVEEILSAYKPQLLFLHFAGVDSVGHWQGWGSEEQITAIENIDRQLRRVFDALERTGMRQSTLVIVSADHGGAGQHHGPDDPRSRHIPWIAAGPGVKRGYDLTRDANLQVRTEDTAATVAYVLGLSLGGDVDGTPVRAAFKD